MGDHIPLISVELTKKTWLGVYGWVNLGKKVQVYAKNDGTYRVASLGDLGPVIQPDDIKPYIEDKEFDDLLTKTRIHYGPDVRDYLGGEE